MESKGISLSKQNILNILLLDSIILAAIYFIPAVSHITRIPLYLLEPMRLLLFTSVLFLPQIKGNQVFLASTMPLVSFFISDHPVFLKGIIMSVELVANIVLLYWLKRKASLFIAVFFSIVLSKALYYIIKIALVSCGLLKMEIITTSILVQVLVALILALMFNIIVGKKMFYGE